MATLNFYYQILLTLVGGSNIKDNSHTPRSFDAEDGDPLAIYQAPHTPSKGFRRPLSVLLQSTLSPTNTAVIQGLDEQSRLASLVIKTKMIKDALTGNAFVYTNASV